MTMRSKIPDVQEAVRRLPGVRSASLHWPDPLGPATLKVEFDADADEEAVTRRVLETLKEVGGAQAQSIEMTVPDAIIPPAAARRAGRPVFSGISVRREALDTRVEVALDFRERRLEGAAEGAATSRAIPRTAAAAALDAVQEALPRGVRLQLEWLEVVEQAPTGRPATVQAAVSWLANGREELYLGSAFVRGDLRDASVRAALDAVNRPLASHLEPSNA